MKGGETYVNVTQVLQSAVETKNKGKNSKKVTTEFKKVFNHQSKLAKEKKSASENKPNPSENPEEKETKAGATSETKTEGVLKEEVETEENDKTFVLVNPFFNLDAQVKDLEKRDINAILHINKDFGEANLNLNEAEMNSKESLPLVTNHQALDLEKLTQNQLVESKLLTEVKMLSDKALLRAGTSDKTLSTEVTELKTSGETMEVIANDQQKQLETLLEKETQTKEGSTDSIVKADKNEFESKGKPSYKASEVEKILSENKINEHLKVNNQVSEVSETTGAKEKIKVDPEGGQKLPEVTKDKTESKTALQSDATKEIKMTESDKHPEAKINTEVFKKSLEDLNAIKSKPLASETDQSGLARQVENQPTTLKSQPVQTNAETTAHVSKEEGMQLIKDMVTRLSENKEGQKTYQTTLHLTPETLGKVVVELSFNEEGLSGKLIFQSDEARRLLEGEWMDLKQPLEIKGLAVKAFDFTTSPSAQNQTGFSFNDHSSQSDQESKQGSYKEERSNLQDENEQIVETGNTPQNGLNVYV